MSPNNRCSIPPVAAHPAEHQHRQGKRGGIHDVQKGIGRQATAAGQPINTKGEQHREGHQHQCGIQTEQDARGDAQQSGVAKGIAEEGKLAQHRKTAQNTAQGTGEQSGQQSPLQEGKQQQLPQNLRSVHGAVGPGPWLWW